MSCSESSSLFSAEPAALGGPDLAMSGLGCCGELFLMLFNYIVGTRTLLEIKACCLEASLSLLLLLLLPIFTRSYLLFPDALLDSSPTTAYTVCWYFLGAAPD
jgi:hypothetical protein